MLLSGSDDSQIIMWDIRVNSVLHVIHEPSVSVSSLALHPQRPFSLVSAHFDNTLIFWDLRDCKQVRESMVMGLLIQIDENDSWVPVAGDIL